MGFLIPYAHFAGKSRGQCARSADRPFFEALFTFVHPFSTTLNTSSPFALHDVVCRHATTLCAAICITVLGIAVLLI